MSTIPQLPRRVMTRKCPGCGYRLAQELIEHARFNQACTRCGEHTIAEFRPDDDPPPPPLPPTRRKAA